MFPCCNAKGANKNLEKSTFLEGKSHGRMFQMLSDPKMRSGIALGAFVLFFLLGCATATPGGLGLAGLLKMNAYFSAALLSLGITSFVGSAIALTLAAAQAFFLYNAKSEAKSSSVSSEEDNEEELDDTRLVTREAYLDNKKCFDLGIDFDNRVPTGPWQECVKRVIAEEMPSEADCFAIVQVIFQNRNVDGSAPVGNVIEQAIYNTQGYNGKMYCVIQKKGDDVLLSYYDLDIANSTYQLGQGQGHITKKRDHHLFLNTYQAAHQWAIDHRNALPKWGYDP